MFFYYVRNYWIELRFLFDYIKSEADLGLLLITYGAGLAVKHRGPGPNKKI